MNRLRRKALSQALDQLDEIGFKLNRGARIRLDPRHNSPGRAVIVDRVLGYYGGAVGIAAIAHAHPDEDLGELVVSLTGARFCSTGELVAP